MNINFIAAVCCQALVIPVFFISSLTVTEQVTSATTLLLVAAYNAYKLAKAAEQTAKRQT